MLVEIPDPEVILGIVVAFLVGVFVLYLFYKLKPYIKFKQGVNDPGTLDRLEYYERQLIDMKIRLDAMDLEGLSTKLVASIPEEVEVEERPTKSVERRIKRGVIESKPIQAPRAPNMGYQNATEYVLRLITDKPMTSRDIQITLGRSREHTSRLMKKLFDDGYVTRNTGSKPYTYSITKKGKEKFGKIAPAPTAG
ncbi:MAG: winged helix DNA-binding protein [Nitrosopumilaceae archaeon]